MTSTTPTFHVSVAGRTDVGRVRKNNEDAYVVADLTGGSLLDGKPSARFDVGERGVLIAVSDGMGGAHAGEVASALVLETLTRAMAEAPPDAPRDARMVEAVERAHDVVRRESERTERKMGATLTAVFVHAGHAFIAEVGDSRAYLLRGGRITQLTRDQSMVQILVESGVITREEAKHSPIRHQILQAMGHQPGVSVAMGRLELRDRDCLLLCSDGLTGHVTDAEILEIVLAEKRPERCAERLVQLANDRGGSDNVTVVVAGVGGELAAMDPDAKLEEAVEVLVAFDPPVPR